MRLPAFATIREDDLPAPLWHVVISQGMYRTLSILARTELLMRLKIPSLLMIDDIGEGLDFERSSRLIAVLVGIAERSELQLMLSTNDRYVMNQVPLKYWQILYRQGPSVTVINHRNSASTFERFSRYGLSNFDFFSHKFFLDQDEKLQTGNA